MSRKIEVCTGILGALLFCVSTMAQEPVLDINKNVHPNLAEAQRLVVEANRYIAAAPKENRYDMQGQAKNARTLLVNVQQERKAAAEAANAGMRR